MPAPTETGAGCDRCCYNRWVVTRKVDDGWRLLRRGPKRLIARRLVGRVWGRRVFYELRCELDGLPDVRPARLPVRMASATQSRLHAALRKEREVATGTSYLQVLYLERFVEAGVEEPFLAHGADGASMYCQWLIRPRDHGRLEAAMPGRYRPVAREEVVLEGAYTFVAFRGLGMMADGMSQLLTIAQEEGYAWATTYVAADNPAALRGCHRAGFQLLHPHVAIHRLGRRREYIDDTPAPREAWARATASPP